MLFAHTIEQSGAAAAECNIKPCISGCMRNVHSEHWRGLNYIPCRHPVHFRYKCAIYHRIMSDIMISPVISSARGAISRYMPIPSYIPRVTSQECAGLGMIKTAVADCLVPHCLVSQHQDSSQMPCVHAHEPDRFAHLFPLLQYSRSHACST